MSKLFERLVEKRGFSTLFLNPRYEDLKDPFILPDMKKAVERIEKAINDGEKILIYGDYDVDGVTASTVMEQALVMAGVEPAKIEIMLPDRFADGYGMSSELVKRAKKQKINLVITVDCGSRNHQIIDELNNLEIDSIITDHHEVGDSLPDSIAVINPKRNDSSDEDLRELAGVGVAFKLAQALVKEGLIREGQEKWLLDLVLIGTICDSMLLTGENRIIGHYGIKVLEKTKRVGLRELMQRAGVKKLNSESIGFQIGPRLNAAGRLDTANISLELLRAKSSAEAAELAEKLESLNKKRKNEQNIATREIEARGISDEPVIIEVGNWHEGILGIVAGRLVDKYKKPAFVLAETSADGVLKGSGRSFGDFNLALALDFVNDLIITGGGHAAAAGVKLKRENLYSFRERINDYYRSLNLENQERFLKKQPDLDVENISELILEFLEELKSLEPFGLGNEEPIFRLMNVQIIEKRKMGTEGQHLRLDVKGKDGKAIKLVAFYAPEKWLNLEYDDTIEPIVQLVENEFNGVRSVEARIIDIWYN
ncbi:single-stranded-DNA-specific exonuclease RecJ [Candidatus Saccharibacteria bacterium]|nr:single-stranded-DNA-specific exonuclease RecJ [Candidatus Saccharibacteria bacterium]